MLQEHSFFCQCFTTVNIGHFASESLYMVTHVRVTKKSDSRVRVASHTSLLIKHCVVMEGCELSYGKRFVLQHTVLSAQHLKYMCTST